MPLRNVLKLALIGLFQWVIEMPVSTCPKDELGDPPMVVFTLPVAGPPPVRLCPAPIVNALRFVFEFPVSCWKFPPVAPQDNSDGSVVVVPEPPDSNVAAVKTAFVEKSHVITGSA